MRTDCDSLRFRAFLVACTLTLCATLLPPAQAQSPANPSAIGQSAIDSRAPQANRVIDQNFNSAAAPVRLAGHIPAWAISSADLGPVPDSKQIQLSIGLSRSKTLQAAFTTLLDEQQNSSSPHFHQWLTPEQIGAQFGPTQHDLDAVANWFTGQGFHVISVSPARTSIQVSAPAAIVGHALHTQLHLFARGADKLQAPTSEPALPAALAPVIAYVAGLYDVPYHTDVHKTFLPAPTAQPSAGTNGFSQPDSAHPNFTASDGVTHYMFPNDFNTIYDIAPLLGGGVTGAGQKIAILSGARLTPSDLTTWESLSGLPSAQPNYIVPPGLTDPGQTNDGNQDEPTLDFERAYGTATGATIDMILATNALTFANTDTMLRYEVNTLKDPILSLSFGVCEDVVPASYIQNEDSIYSQAASEGISVFVSSGDSGVAGCESHGQSAPTTTTQIPSINADCASSYVTCVGGTQFSDLANPSAYWAATNSAGNKSALGYIPEGAFNEVAGQTAGTYQIFASGGGPSTVVPKPSWQKGIGVPADGARDTPDVSFSSSSHDGYIGCLLYTTYDCGAKGSLVFSGTSAAAPSMAGIAALINQKTGTNQGNLNPLLYRLATSTPSDFHDATPATSGVGSCSISTPSTCNNSTPGPNGLNGGLAGYPLTAGYDLVTGLGSLDVLNFVLTSALPHTTVVLTATPSTITISQTVTLTATVSGPAGSSSTPSGSMQFFANGVALMAPVPVSGGVATLAGVQLKPAASYIITATYSGDANFGGSDAAPITLVVTNPNAVSSTTTLTVSPNSGAATQTITLTATVTGTKGVATGTVQFSVDGGAHGVPVTMVAGTATLSGVFLASGSHSITAVYSGDDNYATSTSNAVSVNLSSVASSTSILLSPATTTSSGSITASTTVTGVAGRPIPTGSVTLFQGTNNILSLNLYQGSASISLSGGANGITPGTYTFDWVYSGDATYNASTSANASVVVTGSTVSVAVASPTLTLKAGASASDALTVASSGFAGVESLTCAVVYNGTGTAVSTPTCSVTPASVTLAANGMAASSVTVSTTAAHSISPGGLSENRGITLGGLGGMTLAALLLGFLPRRKRRLLQAARLLSALLFLAGSLTLLSGCGSGSGGYGSGGGSTPGTTAGSYTVTVSANSAAGQAGNTGGAVTIALTVQ